MEVLIKLKNNSDASTLMNVLNSYDDFISSIYIRKDNSKKLLKVRNKEILNSMFLSGSEVITTSLPKEESSIF